MTGSIKDYTTNFNFIIPEFNVATWHDYIEENFRSIDALFHNLFGINGFSGMWKTNSQYTAGQVLFIGEDGGSIYEGRLLKVVNDTNTGGFSTFSEAIEANPRDYELYADASSAQIYSELARDWANKTNGTIITPEGDDTGEYSAKKYAQDSQSSATDAEHFRLLAETDKNIALEAATSAETSAQNSETSAQNALVSEQNSKTSENNAKTSEQNAKSSENNAKVSETNAANSVVTQTNNFNSYNNQLLSTTSTGVSEINSTKTSSIIEIDNTLSNALSEINSKTNVLDKTMIANCLTHIPQDINLELVNGTLTLKAGSKVYIPNGFEANGTTPKFDVVVIERDIEYDVSVFADIRTVCLSYDKNQLISRNTHFECFSGTSAPSEAQYALWYDTTNNLLKVITSSPSWTGGCSLPICIINGSTSIDQVFNGFGYIGSTVFALTGVKGLIPSGRNEDGSLKNIEFTTSSVLTFTNTYANVQNAHWLITSSELTINGAYSYNEVQNLNYNVTTAELFCEFAISQTDSSGKITAWNPKRVFHALNWNDSSTISSWGMPDYSAGVTKSATSYIESYNGCIIVDYTNISASSEFKITISGTEFSFYQGYDGMDYNHCNIGFIPIPKGVQYTINTLINCRARFFPYIGG